MQTEEEYWAAELQEANDWAAQLRDNGSVLPGGNPTPENNPDGSEKVATGQPGAVAGPSADKPADPFGKRGLGAAKKKTYRSVGDIFYDRGVGSLAKGGPGSGIKGHTTADPTESQASTQVAPGGSTPPLRLGEVARGNLDAAFASHTQAANDEAARALTAEKLGLHKRSTDPLILAKDREMAALTLEALGGLSPAEQKIADTCGEY